jgi:hypothetical protein
MSTISKVYGQSISSISHIYKISKTLISKMYGADIPSGTSTNIWQQVSSSCGERIWCLESFNGTIYGGGLDTGTLYEWDGVNSLNPVTAALGTWVRALCSHGGSLYGSAFNGDLYQWNGVNAWVLVAPNPGTGINCLVSSGGSLFGGGDSSGKLFQWNGVNAWVQVANKLQDGILSLTSLSGNIYAGTYFIFLGVGGRLFQWNGVNAWSSVAAKLGGSTYAYDIKVFNGKIYSGSRENGSLREWNGVNAWVELDIMVGDTIDDTVVLNDALFAGGFNGVLWRHTL